MARPTKLNKTVQANIVKLLKSGVSITDTCTHVGIHVDTFYDWLKRGEAGEAGFSAFSEAVTRAKANAKVVAIDTIHNAALPTTTRTRKIHRVTETRENIYGKPYEYKLVDENEYVTEAPGDWRAAVEYLKRRYPDEWSEKRILELGITPELLKRLEDVAKQADVPASQLFENMLNELATQLQDSRAAGDSP